MAANSQAKNSLCVHSMKAIDQKQIHTHAAMCLYVLGDLHMQQQQVCVRLNMFAGDAAIFQNPSVRNDLWKKVNHKSLTA